MRRVSQSRNLFPGISLSSNERGLAGVEATLATLLLIPIIFLSMYLNILTFRITTSHFHIQNLLRLASAGPGKTAGGVTIKNSDASFTFAKNIVDKLKREAVLDIKTGQLLFRNNYACYLFQNNKMFRIDSSYNPYSASTPENQKLDFASCPSVIGPEPNGLLAPNNFVSVELIVDLFPDSKVFGQIFPKPKVTTGMRMGNFEAQQ